MYSLRLLSILPILLFWIVSCSHDMGRDVPESGFKGLQSVLNGEDYKNLIVVPVTIDGKTCHLLVDTGASHTLLRRDIVKKLWPEKSVHHLGGKTISNIDSPLFFAPVGKMSTDSFDVENLCVIVADLPHLGNVGSDPVAGMLGMDVLGNLPMLIDVEKRKVTFFEKRPSSDELKSMGGKKVPVSRDGNHMRAQLVLDGKPLRFIIDTGATQSCMDRRLWKRSTKKSKEQMQWVDVNGISHLQHYDYGLVNNLKWGDVSFKDMPVFFETSEKVMGGDILKRGKLFLDCLGNQAWWIAN